MDKSKFLELLRDENVMNQLSAKVGDANAAKTVLELLQSPTAALSNLGRYDDLCSPFIEQLSTTIENKSSWTVIIKKILCIIDGLVKHGLLVLPENNMRVLSLACGIPFEFMALKALAKGSTRIQYTGIDIDATQNVKLRQNFSNFPECKLIDGDASDPLSVLQLLKKQDAALTPFSVIFLRHPDILNAKRGKGFQDMVENVIPFVAAKNAFVFISTHSEKEARAIYAIFEKSLLKPIYQPMTQAYVGAKVISTTVVRSPDGKTSAVPDAFTHSVKCQGRAFTFADSREKIVAWMVYLTKNLSGASALDWKYSVKNDKTPEATFLTSTDQELLKTIKHYFEKHGIKNIKLGAIVKQTQSFCIQIWDPSAQMEVIEQIPPIPKEQEQLAQAQHTEKTPAVDSSTGPSTLSTSPMLWQHVPAQNTGNSATTAVISTVAESNAM